MAEHDHWKESYRWLPFGAGEEEIAACSTPALRQAYECMRSCSKRPPAFGVLTLPEFFLGQELLTRSTLRRLVEDTVDEEGERRRLAALLEPAHGLDVLKWQVEQVAQLLHNEGVRYPRVCRELASRVWRSDPSFACQLLKEALAPSSLELCIELGFLWEPLRVPLDSLDKVTETLNYEHATSLGMLWGPGDCGGWLEWERFLELLQAVTRAPLDQRRIPEPKTLTVIAVCYWLVRQEGNRELLEKAFPALANLVELADVLPPKAIAAGEDLNRASGDDVLLGLALECLFSLMASLLALDMYHEGWLSWTVRVKAAQVVLHQRAAWRDDHPQTCDGGDWGQLVSQLDRICQHSYDCFEWLASDFVERQWERVMLAERPQVAAREQPELLGEVRALHDRQDLVYEGVVDIRQMMETALKWISEEGRRRPEEALRQRIGDAWELLGEETRDHLVRAFDEWLKVAPEPRAPAHRRIAHAICLALEGELRKTYDRALAAIAQQQCNEPGKGKLSFGELLDAVISALRTTKEPLLEETAKRLAERRDRLTRIRNRSAHATGKPVTSGDVGWLMDEVVGIEGKGLLAGVVRARQQVERS